MLSVPNLYVINIDVYKRQTESLYHLYYGEHTILPEHIEMYSIPLIDFVVRKPVTLMLPMAIDFGSVNTTAGVYLDSAYFSFGISISRFI